MKNAHFVQNNPSKRMVRRLINQEILSMVRSNWGKIVIETMPSTQASHEIGLIRKLFSQYPKLIKNITFNLYDYKRSVLNEADKNIREYFYYDHNGLFNVEDCCKYSDVIRSINYYSGNILSERYDTEEKPHVCWYDLCSGPTEKNVKEFIYNAPSIHKSKFFITFIVDGKRESEWAKGLSKKSSPEQIQKYIADRFIDFHNEMEIVPIENFPVCYETKIQSDYINTYRKVVVLGFNLINWGCDEIQNQIEDHKMSEQDQWKFEHKIRSLLTKNQNSLELNSDMSKNNNNTKTPERYAELSQRFTNKQIAVFWKASLQQIAGYAAAARRKGLV